MRTFKFFWTTHKWTGIGLAAFLTCTSVTGFLLLVKKRADWIQPPTMTGRAGDPAEFITIDRLLEVVRRQDHPDFRSAADVERVDLRPAERVFKVRSRHHHAEIQVCAVTGEVLGVATRRSDLIEDLHDGSFLGAPVHDWIMPAVAVLLPYMVFSGLWLWLEPAVRRRRRPGQDRRNNPGTCFA